jgi:hypothetical protein
MHQGKLTNIHTRFVFNLFLSILNFPEYFVCAHSIADAFAIRFIRYSIKVYALRFNLKDWVSIIFLLFSSFVRSDIQFPHEYAAIPTTRNKPRVIIKPLNASDLSYVGFKSVFRGTLSCIELKNADVVLVCASEQMASVREPNFSATLDRDLLESFKAFGKYIHHSHFICKSNYYMEARWMKGQTVCFILKYLAYL